MTNEEKVKAYDEAMNKIKPLYEQAKKDGNPIWSTYEYLIPELAESEDEKIRKEIVDFIRWAIDRGSITKEQREKSDTWFSYLEKQKEQKPNYCHYGGDPSVERCKYCSAACSARLTEEQKPAEWNMEDEQNLNVCLSYIKDEPLQNWLKDAIRVRYNKPVEWSEEDEKIRQSIIKDIEFERNYTSATTGTVIGKYNEQINWLKALFLNLKKKNEDVAKLCSNEWSEEDENIFNDILVDMADRREMFKSNGEIEFAEDTQKKIDWLSSHLPKFQSSYPQQKSAEWSVEDEKDAEKAATDYADENPGMTHENDGSTVEDYDKPYWILSGVHWAKTKIEDLRKNILM